MSEENFGKGAIQSKKDSRDYQYSNLGSSAIPFDWNIGFDIEEKVGKLPVKDQAQSSSCGGQAWASYSYVLDETNREEKSAKYIYCQTHVGSGGSTGRDNCEVCRKQGVSKEILCPSYPATEQFMTTDDRTPEAIADAKTNKEKYYGNVNIDIEEVARAIRDCNGVILGICGQNNGTWLSKFPLSPKQRTWAHWVYAGKAKIIDGKKYIGFLNSWGKYVGEDGWQYVGEEYFNNPLGFFEIWTMTYDSQIKPNINMPVLKFGSKGDSVKTLQKLLNAGLVIDGKFGQKTKIAVMEFQRAHGLTQDGIVGVMTWEVLLK